MKKRDIAKQNEKGNVQNVSSSKSTFAKATLDKLNKIEIKETANVKRTIYLIETTKSIRTKLRKTLKRNCDNVFLSAKKLSFKKDSESTKHFDSSVKELKTFLKETYSNCANVKDVYAGSNKIQIDYLNLIFELIN